MSDTDTCRCKGKRIVGALLGVLAVVVLTWQTVAWQDAGKAAGIYMAKGGRSLIVLERGFFPKLKVVHGYFPTISPGVGAVPDLGISTRCWRNRLVFSQREEYPRLQITGGRGKVFLHLELIPSEDVSGDWDLVAGDFALHFPSLFAVSSAIASAGRASGGVALAGSGISGAIEDLARSIKERLALLRPQFGGLWIRHNPLVKSFLHRVNDPRLIDYFELRAEGRFTGDDLEGFREVLASHMDDAFLQVHAIDVEARYGDPAKAAALMEEWRNLYEPSAGVLLREAAQASFKSVSKAQGKLEGEDLRDLIDLFQGDRNSLQSRLDFLKDHLKYNHLVTTAWPLVEPTPERYMELMKLPNYVDLQIQARVARTMAILYLLQGRHEESLEILAGLYRQGQMLNFDVPSIQRLIGMVIRQTASEALEIFVLNACETSEDFDACLALFERLDGVSHEGTAASVCAEDFLFISPVSLMKRTGGTAPDDTEGVWIRHRVVDMGFQLVRAAAAARKFFVVTGDYPRSASDFLSALPEGLPKDAFSEEVLRFTPPEVEPYTVYSFGPDGEDGGGRIQYAPTNGTKSAGDLLVRVSREREFPFPREGVRASSAKDLLGQFSNGLPEDVFAFLRGNRTGAFSIVDSSTDSPVAVLSYGPNGLPPQEGFDLTVYGMPGFELLEAEAKTSKGPNRSLHRQGRSVGREEGLSAKPHRLRSDEWHQERRCLVC